MGKLEDDIRERIEFHYGSIPKFAKEIGMSPQTVYTVLKSGINGGSINTVLPILSKLGIDSNWIIKNKLIEIGKTGDEYVDVPLFSSIAAGTPIELMEVDATHPIPTAIHERYPDARLFKVEGESMNRILPNGCYALIDPCREITQSGKPYAVCVNGYDATIKRVELLNNGFRLVPDSTDPTYPVQTFNYNEPGTETITVMGRVVYYVLPFDWSF